MKKYIKQNDGYSHLSLGNLLLAIKKYSKNKSGAIQTEVFCTLFNIESITDTTVNNYCTGYRGIGDDYKQIYINFKKKYKKDKSILIPIINNTLSIIDGEIYDIKEIDEINNKDSIKKTITNLHTIVKNDIYVPNNFKVNILSLIKNKDYYSALCEILFYVILENKQPLYEEDLITETIEEILKDTNISIKDLQEYLSITFKEGISLIPSLKKLADNNNPYALYELGNKEYRGEITGYPRYEEAYNYHLKAASYNHPTSNWMIAHMIINKKIGSMSKDDLDIAFKYLEKAISLGSISALNTMGLCYMEGIKEKDNKKAYNFFKKAAEKKYVYAYNNLGRLHEQNKEYEKALEYYLKSANSEESWACNKVGLYYYLGIGTKKDIEKSFYYFNLGNKAPINIKNPWNTYNLVKLFYSKGNAKLGIKKDIDKSISMLNTLNNFEPANELLLYLYYEKYLNNKNEENLNKLNYYLNTINNTKDYSIKKKIEKELNKIKNYSITINE